jgi:hypothetical protein
MSRNSKGYRTVARRKANTLARKNGNPGPAKTMPQHGKRWTYRHNPEVAKRVAEMIKATAVADRQAKTSGKALLAKAGGASKE